MIRSGSILTTLLIGFATFALAQNQAPNDNTTTPRSVPATALTGIAGMDGDSGPGDDYSLPQIPSFLGGQGSQLALAGEAERANFLRGGINVSEGYNDNPFLAPNTQVGNATFSVFPSIAIIEAAPRNRWSLAYGAGLTVNQRLSSQNQGSHNLTFDSIFRLTPHVDLHASENFALVSGLFGATTDSSFQPPAGGANATLITPLATQRSSRTLVESDYHFSLKDLVGVSGSFYDLHFSNVGTAAGTLSDTRTATASGFWLHQLFHGDWAGVDYRFQRITYDPSGETRVHTFSFTDTLALSKAFHISGFIGPEYSENQGVAASGPTTGVTNFSEWGVSGGVEGGWQSMRTSVTGGYSKQVSDGSGILGAVRLQNIHAAMRRKLSPFWTVDLLGSYGDNQALTLAKTATATSIRSTTIGGSVEHNIGRHIDLQFAYFHDFQDQSGSTDNTQNYNVGRNRVLVNLSYQWQKPLGR